MPLIAELKYTPPYYLFHGHLETMYPFLFRKIEQEYDRERLELPDGDFLDLDWSTGHGNRLVILCHGLEGNSSSQYMKGMCKAMTENGFDVLAINFRSCSGEMNRLLRMYHHGEIGDLTYIIDTVLATRSYQALHLCGFSLGGNVILKYLGTLGPHVPLQVRSAMAVSVPCNLASSSTALDRWDNYLYTRHFMNTLYKKFEQKNAKFPNVLNLSERKNVRTWEEFDNQFTTKITKFKDADAYYEQASANNFLSGIKTATLLINAKNDPFLAEPSYPYARCAHHDFVHLETPRYGGHVGFWHPKLDLAYTEKRALAFFAQHA